MPRIGVLLALDISKKAIGIAVSDPQQLLATPLLTLYRRRWLDDLGKITTIARERKVVGLVIGYPLNMDGSAGPAAQARRDHAHAIAHSLPDMPILLQDERLTTQAVADAFAERRWPRPKGRDSVDHYAAAIILEDAMRAIAYAANRQEG